MDTTIPEDTELTQSKIEVDSKIFANHSSTELNHLLCCGVILALIDIFVIPITALILGISTIRIFRTDQDYATCSGNDQFDCVCEELGDSDDSGSCSLLDDDWFAVIRVFAILYCCVYEGSIFGLQILLFLYNVMTYVNPMSASLVIGVQGLRRIDRFNLCNFMARLFEFVWVLIMVMSYLNIRECSCSQSGESVDYNDSFYERSTLHAYCEILMMFLLIHLVGTRVMKCCLSGRRTSGEIKALWLEMYIISSNTKEEEHNEPWSSYQSGLTSWSRSSSIEP